MIARGEREQCNRRDDPRARGLWRELRARYDTASDTLSLWSEVTVATGVVPPSRFLQFDTTAAAVPHGYSDRWDSVTELRDGQDRLQQVLDLPYVGRGRRGMSGRMRATWAARIARNGYATRTGSSDLSGAYEAWEYPPLEGELADHFLSRLFGAMSRFAVAMVGDETRLLFCARPPTGGGSALVGALVLAPDGSLAAASWRFHHRGKSEVAGGTVAFAPAGGSTRRPLVAATGTYYRRQGGSWFQRRQVFEGWELGERAGLPASLSHGPVTDLRPGIDPGPARTPARGN